MMFFRIYVDAVINHMAAGGNTGSGGEFDREDLPIFILMNNSTYIFR